MSVHGEIDKTLDAMEMEKTNNFTSKTSTIDNNVSKKSSFEANSVCEPAGASIGAPADKSFSENEKDERKTEGKDCKKHQLSENKTKLSIKDDETSNRVLEDEDHKSVDSDIDNAANKKNLASKRVTESKDENGSIEMENMESREDEEEDDKENSESILTLSAIGKINENINKTRVDVLQCLYLVCFGVQGKNNVVKKNLRAFSGFEFRSDSNEFKKKLDFLKKTDGKSLRSICEILSLDHKGTKEEVADRVLKFLIEPNESVIVETAEDIEEESDEEQEVEKKVEIEEQQSEEDKNRKRKRSNPQSQTRGFAGRNSSGRPRRSTAGKKMSAYVDFSSSEESVQKAPISRRRRRNDDSESGSDYNPSGANSDSEAGLGKRQMTRGTGRGRPTRKARRPNSDSDEDESYLSDADSDTPKSKRTATSGKGRGRPPIARGGFGRARREALALKKRNVSESEEASEGEEPYLESDRSEKGLKSKMKKKSDTNSAPGKNRKSNIHRSSANANNPKKSKKESSSEEDLEEKDKSENEPPTEKGGSTFPTDEEIKNYVKKILDKANLEEITMKTVCKKVYARFPDFDLAEKKDFIKATVKALIAA